ncbi:hypothetical protein OF83DRAFT_571707 [Amylostereum chailletii]|nr:hypothetical protein OF83DRAFT_571707 [Amylostereum chailletii]
MNAYFHWILVEDISPENAHDSTYHTPPHDPVTDSSQEDPALAALLSLYPAPRPSPNTICPRSSSFASRPPNTTQHPEPLSASGPQTSRSSPTPITRFMGTPLLPTPRSMVGTSSPPEDTPSPHILPSLAANDLCIPGPLEPPVLTVKFMDGTVPPMGIAGIEMKSLTGARVLEIVAARTGLDVENCCLAQGGWPIDHNQNLHDFGVSPGDQIYFRRNV